MGNSISRSNFSSGQSSQKQTRALPKLVPKPASSDSPAPKPTHHINTKQNIKRHQKMSSYETALKQVQLAVTSEEKGNLQASLNYYIRAAEILTKGLKTLSGKQKEDARSLLTTVLTEGERVKALGLPPAKRMKSGNRKPARPCRQKKPSHMEPMYQRIEEEIVDKSPGVKFSEVKGLRDVKQALYETIIMPSSRPDIFTGIRAPPRGLLFFGPPGNGKTMIAKAVASECKSTFFSISASSLVSKYVGDSEKLMKALFALARERAPSIVFIDEIDAILKSRSDNEKESSRRLKTEFLVQFDGVAASADDARVLVIGATNLPWELDEAALRRFPKRYEVPLPDSSTRRHLLKSIESKVKVRLSDDDLGKLVKRTKGYSCSDIAELCKDAAMGPVRDMNPETLKWTRAEDLPPVKYTHFLAALSNVRQSVSPSSLNHYNTWAATYGSTVAASGRKLNSRMVAEDEKYGSSSDGGRRKKRVARPVVQLNDVKLG